MNKRTKLIILIGAGLLLILAVSTTFWANQFRVVKTVPTNGGSQNLENSLSIEWNRPIQKEVRVKTEPSFDFTATVKDNELTIRPKTNLVNNTFYTVIVSNIKQIGSNKAEENAVLSFNAVIIPFDQLSAEHQQEIVGEVDPQYHKYPLLAILPTQHPDFSIDARYIGDTMYIVITPAVFAPSLSEEEYKTAYKTYYDEAINFLTLERYKLKDHNIIGDQEFLRLQQEATTPGQ